MITRPGIKNAVIRENSIGNGIFSDHKSSLGAGLVCPQGYTFLLPVIRINLQVLAGSLVSFALVDPVSIGDTGIEPA